MLIDNSRFPLTKNDILNLEVKNPHFYIANFVEWGFRVSQDP